MTGSPFGSGDGDRHAIWTMLVERDIEAFVARDWGLVAPDFVKEGFFGIDARGRDRPESWRLAFPTVARYRDAWLAAAERLGRLAEAEALHDGLHDATVLRDIDIDGDVALARKTFDGSVALHGGGLERLRWQTLYTCRRVGTAWRIASLVGYLPNPMGSPERAARKSRPSAATQHATAGPYSPVLRVEADRLVVISGQAAISPDGTIVGEGFAHQARLTLENCRLQLASAGCDFGDVFKVTVFLRDLADWPAFNEAYGPLMPEPRPVRTAVQAALLPGLLVEVEMWAITA